jgi:hypothetical protein
MNKSAKTILKFLFYPYLISYSIITLIMFVVIALGAKTIAGALFFALLVAVIPAVIIGFILQLCCPEKFYYPVKK